ncbi:MAG: glycoside hydrolase family 43 protein [Clostridium sp.]|nr:glycoside hydrolase family 43 protein [Clostridium sp.]
MKKSIALAFAACCFISGIAQMPIVQTNYTADPAPLVHNDTIFLYTSHDEDNAEGFLMKNWLLYTSTDMVNWQDRGAVASLDDFKWFDRDNGAWAIQVVERNGKFYMYCPLHGHGIGVLVSDSPYGPFKDPLGEPLVWQREHWYDIDPTVMIDDDGQAYLYWGNPNLYMVKLNEDMISYSGEIIQHPAITDYQEGPWLYRRGDNYYLAFASTCCPEGIGYAMSKSIEGPWEYHGHIMNHTDRTRGNHPGIIDYKGKTYLFGQNSDLLKLEMPEYKERRSVSAAEMHFNADGTIQEVPYWFDTKIEQIEPLDPYRLNEAEKMAWGYGLKTTPRNPWAADRWNQLVVNIDDGEYIKVRGVDFGEGAKEFTANVSCPLYGGVMEIRLDDEEGPKIGEIAVTCTKNEIAPLSCAISGAEGVHDLYFVFKGSKQQKRNLFNFDSWKFSK